MKQKHVPLRTCIACRTKSPKREMVRIVKDGEGNVFIDAKGKVRGRGANLCANAECLDKALEKKIIASALRLESPLSEQLISDLKSQFNQVLHEREFREGNKKVVYRVLKNDLLKSSKEV